MKKILKENYIYILLIICLLIGFMLCLHNENISSEISKLDNKIIIFVDNIVNDNLTFVFRGFTLIGDIYIPIIFLVCLFLFFKNKWYFYLQGISYLVAGSFTYLSKRIIYRPRPVVALIDIPGSYSFPSGHTLTSIVFYLMLWYLLSIKLSNKWKKIYFILALILVFMIGFSRIYLGVHFISDVLGGCIFGVILIFLLIKNINLYFHDKIN